MKLRKISAGLAAITLCFAAGCAAESTEEQQEKDQKEVTPPEVVDSKITPQTCAPPGTCAQLSRNCKVPGSGACNLYYSRCVSC